MSAALAFQHNSRQVIREGQRLPDDFNYYMRLQPDTA
jgi:hypothetical protein